jgi:hypothetical protein
MRLNVLSTPLLVLGCAFFLGCPPAGKDDSAVDPADTDTDTDADTDTDTDTDTTHVTVTLTAAGDDVSVAIPYSYDIAYEADFSVPSTSEGTLTYNFTYDGTPVCDFVESVTTTPYEGDCADCTFAMVPTTTVTEDNGTADCSPDPLYSLQGGSIYANLFMLHLDTYEGYYGDYTNAFQVGFAVDYAAYGGGYYEGPYFSTLSYDSSYYSTFTVDDSSLAWTFASEGYGQDFGSYYTYCSYFYGYQTYGVYPGTADTSSLDCDGEIIDTWTFEGVEGGTAYVTVDTVADETAFDPRMWVNDPDGCTIAAADDSFACTYPPPTYECPGVIVEDLTAGTYTVVVNSYGDCAGETADYSLAVDITTPI